jgi:hypothetical protein
VADNAPGTPDEAWILLRFEGTGRELVEPYDCSTLRRPFLA